GGAVLFSTGRKPCEQAEEPMRHLLPLIALALCAVTSAADKKKDELFVAKPLTEKNGFTAGIEGPCCDRDGNLYLVALKKATDIAKVTPDGKAEVWVELPGKSTGNGIVFDRKGTMFVADYGGHNVLKINPKTKKIE